MGNKATLGLIVLAAIVGLFFLMGGTDLLSGGGAGPDGGAARDDGGLLGAEGADPDGKTAGEAAERGPTLFGRARADRKGQGELAGRVMDFKSGKPVGDARITIAGLGYGGERVTQQVRVDPSGYFQLQDVAAGDGFVLKVSDGQGRERTLPSQSVDHGGHTDVGTIWLGKRGTLTGRVVDDQGQAVAAADVQVHPGGSSMLEMLTNMSKLLEQLDKDAEPLARAESDAQGAFTVPDLAPGPLTLVVRAAGHRQVTLSIVMAQEGAAGGAVRVRMPSAEAVTGIVVDQDGRPVAGARVACLVQQNMQSVFYGRQFSETGADGRFVIASPPTNGELAVIVTASGYPTLFTKTSRAGEQRFTLIRGTEVTVRVVFQGSGQPVEGAQLMAMFSGTDGFESKDGMTFASGATDGRGRTTFVARPGTLQMLYLMHPEHGTTVYSPMLQGMGGMAAANSMLKGPKEVKVATKPVTFEFELGIGITIHGRVLDESGAPIAGARCAAMGAMGMGGTTRSDADGKYELKNQGPPVRFVLVSKPGYVQQQGKMTEMMASMKTEDAELDVVMARAASVAGRVLLDDGRPAVGARVKAHSGEGMAMLSAMTGGGSETITNRDGRYVLDGVHPGKKVHVAARHAGFLDAKTAAFEVAAAGATQAPELKLRRGVVLTVQVLRPDGRPASGADVEVDLDQEERVAWDLMGGFGNFAELRTPAGGTVEVADVPEGKATITVRHDDHAPGRAKAVIPARKEGKTVEVVVRLRAGVEVPGRVVDQDGAPVVGARVMIQRVEPEDLAAWVPMALETTDAQGGFLFKGVPGVSITLQVQAEGYREIEETITPGLGEVILRVAPRSAQAAERLAEIEKELQSIYVALGSAKDDDARQVAMQRLRALNREKAELEGK